MDAFSASLMADKREIVFAPTVYKFQTFAQMAEEFQLNERDVVLTNERIFHPYMEPQGLKCQYVFRENFGKGEPSEEMIQAMYDAIPYDSYDRVIAIGGGAILSPFLVSIFGLPVHAIAGALLLGTFLASLAGVLGYGFLGLFSSLDGIGADPLLGLLLGLGGLMGSYLGARCQRFVPARRIKWGLALILLFTSLRYLWQGL